MTNTDVAVVNQAMLDRGATTRKASVMDNLHKIKLYNANPFSNDPKEKEVQEDLVGKLRVVEAGTWEIKYIDSNVKVNILSVCKVKSGNVFVLDEFGDPVKDENGKSKKAFFFTNEHSVYTRKTDMLWFKQAWAESPIWFYIKSDIEEMLKTKKINWKENPFWKQWTKADGEPYNDTNIKDTIIIYGKFLSGPYEWEYFKFVPVSTSWYGTTFKNGVQIEASKWTFLHAVSEWLVAWNAIRNANGKSSVTSVDPSQLDMTISFKETEVQGKRMFIPTFKFDNLTAYRADNTEDLNIMLEMQSEYLEEEFGVRVVTNNFRLWSISDVNVANVNAIEVKAIWTSKEVQQEEDEVVEITIEAAWEVFDTKSNEQIKKTNAEILVKEWVPF